jgi:hypothetical protein
MKKNEPYLFLLACFAVGFCVGLQNKKKFTDSKPKTNLTITNYVNRLKEFDLTEHNDSVNFFYDLIEIGFHPDSAFEVVKKECIEVGETFND